MRGEPRHGHLLSATVGALLAVVPLVLAGLWGVGHVTHVVDLVDRAAWLVSPTRGLVSLVDGPTAQVAVTLRLPVADAGTTVVQARGAAFVVRGGTIARIDAATWTLGRAVELTDGAVVLTVLPGATPDDEDERLWVLDGRTVRAVDPRTLQVRATADLRLDDVRAVVDDRGELWVADDDRAVRVRLEEGGLRVAPAAATGGELVLVEGRTVLVDPGSGAVRALDGPGSVRCARSRTGGTDARVVGSTTSPEVFAAVDGRLLVAGIDGSTCEPLARLGGPDADLGGLVQVGGYVVAPDRATGVTTVVDRRTGTPQTFALTPPGHRVELVVQGSTVFWNDLDGHGSGLLELDAGSWRSIAVPKYDPATGAGAQVTRTGAPGPAAVPADPARFRVAALDPDRTQYAPGARAVVTADVTGEPTADEAWWWRVEDLVTGAVEDFGSATPGAPLAISALPGAGEYGVTLAVLRDGERATATTTLRVVTWCALTVSAEVVDLTVDPTLAVSVDPACPVQQQIEVVAEPWLEVSTTREFAPGSPGSLTLRVVGTPPTGGPVPGALRLGVVGQPDSEVRVAVAGAAP